MEQNIVFHKVVSHMAEQAEKKTKVELCRPQKDIITKLKDELDKSSKRVENLEYQIDSLLGSKTFRDFQCPVYLDTRNLPKVITKKLSDNTVVAIKITLWKDDDVYLEFQVMSEKSNIKIYMYRFDTKKEEECEAGTWIDNMFYSKHPLSCYTSEGTHDVTFDCREVKP